jgi:hypothetical protein
MTPLQLSGPFCFPQMPTIGSILRVAQACDSCPVVALDHEDAGVHLLTSNIVDGSSASVSFGTSGLS